MSLNHREIDRVLQGLDLEGAKIEKVLQPSYDSVVLRLYKAGVDLDLLISIAHGACRVHALSRPAPKPERPLRFQECLKSRIRGANIVGATQIGDERILRLDLEVIRLEGEAEGATVYKPLGPDAHRELHGSSGPTLHRYRLYARLWSGAGNIILAELEADGNLRTIDALARRPKRGEVSGEVCRLEEEIAEAKVARLAKAEAEGKPLVPRVFEPRDFPPLEGLPEGGSYNRRVEAFYAAQGGELSRESLLASARDGFLRRKASLEARISALEARATEYRNGERFRELGDILMANQGLAATGRFLDCEDFFRGGRVAIEIDPTKTKVANAQAYYERYRKAASGLGELEAEILATKASLAQEAAELARLESIREPLLIARALAKGGTVRTEANKDRRYPGLSLERKGWTILIGRSAKENDELLRRHVRGSDLWMHARDFAGSYVFVKAKAGKSFPLDILVEAGNLAIYYSKGRANGGGELYYTLVKHLRRAKDGPKGLVLPSQEKNLHVVLQEDLLRELRSLIGDET